jgi:transposase-like protein
MKRLLSCPKCCSDNLDMKKSRGLERILILLSGKRKFRCHHCNNGFRAIDHNRTESPSAARTPVPQRHIVTG